MSRFPFACPGGTFRRFLTREAKPCFVAAVALLAATGLQAATITWTGAGADSFWHNSTNWSGGVLPGPADDVTISLAGASVVFSQGTNTVRSVTCSRPLTLSGGALTVTNGFNLNNIVFTFTGGTLDVTNLATVTGGTTALKDGQIVGQLKVVNGNLTFSNNAAATGTVVFNGSNNRLNSDVPPGMLLWVQGGGSSTGELDITNNVVNRGTILLQTTVSTFASGLDVSAGAMLINETNGTIQVRPGTGGTRPLDGWLENRGTILVESNTTFTVQGTTPRWTQKAGLVQGLGEFRLSGGRVDFEGGRLEGVVRAFNSFITVSNSVSEASTLRVIGNTGVLGGNHSPLVTLWVEGGGSSTGELNITNTVVNRGTILLETSTSTFNSVLDVNAGAVLLNGTNAVIQANAGTGGLRTITGYLENHGILRGNTELSFQNGTFDFRYGRIEGLVRFTSSFLKVAGSVTEISTVRAIGSTCVLGGNESPAVTIWVEGGAASTGELDVTNNVVNRGTILLETSTSTFESRLGIGSGARLTNDVGGLIRASAGTGGTRSITGTLENFGTVRANTSVIFTVQALVQRAGVVLGEGECRLTGLFDFRGGQLIGTVRANGGYIAVADTVTQVSTLSVVGGTGVLASNASPSVTLWIEGHPSFGAAGNLTVTNNTFNRGTLLLDVTTAGGYSSTLTVNSGVVLTNLTNGVIQANLGPGGARTFSGELENWGTVVAGTNLTFTIPGRLRQMAGVLRGDGTLVKQGGVFEFNGGRLEGNVRMNGSFICVADTVSEASTISVVGGAGILASNASPAVTLWIEGHPSYGSVGTLTVTNNTFNRGTILLDVTTAGGYASELTVNAGVVLTNATNGVIQASVGPGGARTFNGELENRGTVRATSNATFTVNGRLRQAAGVLRGDGTLLKQGGIFEFNGGRLEGQIRAHGAFIAVADTMSEPSTLLVTGSSGVLASNASPAVTLWIDAGPAYGSSGLLNVTNRAVNRGTIRLEVTAPGGYSSEMAVGAGAVLVNATNGVIEANVGPGGPRTISGSVTNQGLLSLDGVTLNLTTGPFVNDVPGLITGTGAISFSGNIFTNHGTVSPGASPGILSFSGNYIQSAAGRLNIEINGTTEGTNYDRLAVTGAATLDGTLNVTVAEEYLPAISNTFSVLTFTSRNGDFANYNGLDFYTNRALVANFTGTALNLVTVSATNQTFTVPTIVSQPTSKTVVSGQPATFNVTAAGTRPFSYQWRFNGTNLAGATSSILALSNVQTNQAGDYRVVVTNLAGSVTSSIAVLTVQPISDLIITDLIVPTNVFAGQPVALNWRAINQGSQTAPAPWTESVGISTNASGVPETGLASFTFTNSLGAGQSLVRTQTVNVSGGLDGEFYWVFHTDIHNQVVEQVNETNNTTVSTSSVRVRSPDLQPTAVAPASSSAVLGQSLAVSWISTNAGSAPVSAPWSDRVYLGTLSNNLSGALPLAISTVSNVPLAAFGLATNSANVTLPLSGSWLPGNYFLLVSVDYANAVAEFAETNNLRSAPLTLTLPPLPDLAAVNVLAPSNALPGQTVALAWSTTNRGSLAITGWSETIYLVTNSTGAGLLEITTFEFTNTLAPGGFVTRTQNVTVPIASPLGNSWFAVLADSRDDVFEGIETNNLGVAQSPTDIPAVLTLQLSAAQISEAAAQPIQATVTRNGSRASPLLVTITNNDSTELIAQTNVIILAGQASVSFNVFALPDGVVDGPQTVQISAVAASFSNAVASVTVLDSDLPHLAVTVTNIAFEGAALTAKVSRDAGTNTAVVVNVTSSNPGRLMPTTPVTIPVNQFSTNITLYAVDDLLVQIPLTNTITVSAANHVNGSTEVVVLDNDLPVVTLSLAATNVSENAGPQATIATLQRSPVTATPIYVELMSTNPGALLVPSLVTIPASEASASVPVAAVNNDLLDGPKLAEVRFWVKTSAFGSRVAEGAPVLVTVTDDEGPALKLTLAQSLVPEGASPATIATVSRNTGTNSSLLVNLASSNTGEATVPVSVTIAAGATATNFNVTTPTDGFFDSNKVVTISASAAGFASASAPLTVTDVNQPDLVIQSISAPTNAETEAFVSLGYTIRNQGLSAMASNTLVQRIYLSRDPVVGDDLLMGEYSFNGALPAGPPFGQTFSVRLPQEAGDYWVIAETDVQNAVAEILEDNNRRISASPIHVTAAYDAVVSTTLQSAPANTPVPLTGQAFKPGSIPAPFVLVNIHINVRGLHRVISALTDFAGNFSTTWQPLPGEAGFYEIGAAHPGFTNAPAQDSFALYGMNAVPASPTVTLMGQGVVTGAVDIVNSGDLALNSVSAQVLSPPGNLNFNVSMPTNFIPGLGSSPLTYTINSTDGLAAQGVVAVRLTSAEGATLDVPFSVTVKPLTPQLEVTPSQLVRGMKRGVQTMASFVVTNVGGAASGPITVSLPSLDWLSVASANPLPSLAPGEGASVSLQLTPPTNMPLTAVTGNLLLGAGGNVTAMPFEFRALSESKGDLRVTASDEFTYYAVGAPKVTNAVAVLRDAVSGVVVTNGVTGTNGEWFTAQLPEGYYELEVTAEKHTAYKGTHLLLAGVTNDIGAFMSRQTVRYTWTVVPTEIEDRYKIVVNTEFEANVPAPVVTIEPAVIDLADLEDEMQVDLKIENHGLIAAEDFELQFDEHESVVFEPLVSRLGTLPAKSTFTVPLKIRRVSAAILGGPRKNAINNVGACFATGRGIDHFQCGPFFNVQVTTISFPNAASCISEVIRTIYDWFPGGGGVVLPPRRGECQNCYVDPVRRYYGYYSSSGGGSRLLDLLLAAIYQATPALAVPNLCDPDCLSSLIPALIGCFGPEDDGPDPCPENVGNCLPPLLAHPSEATVTDCMAEGLTCWFDYAKKNPAVECLFDLLSACAPQEEEAAGPAKGKKVGKRSFSGPYAGLIGTLQTRVDRVVAVNDFYLKFLGDAVWRDTPDQNLVKSFFGQFNAVIAAGSDAGKTISAAELAGLLAEPLPTGATSVHVNHAAERWNRSVSYWNAGIFNLAQVPNGDSTDFLALDQLHTASVAATNAIHENQLEGFSSLAASLIAAKQDIADAISEGSGGTCAKVKLRLDQEAVMSRDAFKATLEIDNREGRPLENLYVTLGVLDSAGNDASALFSIRAPELSGVSGTNGNGSLADDQIGQITWTLVPTVDAAPTNSTQYFVSGGLNYIVNSNAVSIPLSPATITVRPSPRLVVNYFHQRDVFSDDPFTDEVEPAIPFSLGVMVQNRGQGTAKNFHITSAQPVIVENEKGLLIDFKIIATEVAGQNLQPTLTADMGDIGPGTNAIARWLLTSTLQGLFIDYSASFEHVDGLGNPKLSLIDEVNIHEMIHVVQAAGAFADGRPDFLVNDVPDIHDFPDTIYLSGGATNHVEAVTNGVIIGTLSPGNLQVQLDAPLPGGWSYLRVPDPADGDYRLVGVMRSDGAVIGVETNAWVTDRTFRGLGKKPVRENILHIFDYNSTGTYTLTYALLPQPDTTLPTSAVVALPAESASVIPLAWSGADNVGVAGYDIYVSENGGAFTRWLERTINTGAIYQGLLSNNYAFYSVAMDQAGNREAAPATPDAATTVTRTNHAPVLTAITNRTIVEGATLSVSLTVSDADGDAVTLSLGSGAPAGVSINSQTRILTWATGEAHGPSTNNITVIARDNGLPQLSASQSFTVVVLESNLPPSLVPISGTSVAEGQLLSFTAVASDLDLPPQPLAFSLAGAPLGATIDSGSGLFTWTPGDTQGGVTNLIKVIVTDNPGSGPGLSVTQAFSVVVLDTQPDFRVNIGTTQLLAGAGANLPFTLHSGLDLTNVQWVLAINNGRLQNLALQDIAPAVGSADFQPFGSNRYTVRFNSQAGGFLQGNLLLARVGFDTGTNEHSAISHLAVESLAGSRASAVGPINSAGGKGRVFIVGLEPLLDARADNGQFRLALYGQPGSSFQLSYVTNLANTNWLVALQTPQTNLVQEFVFPTTLPQAFYRAEEFVPDPPMLVMQGLTESNTPLLVYGRRGSNYILEATTDLSGAGGWVVVTNVTSTNAFNFFKPARGTNKMVLFRVRRP